MDGNIRQPRNWTPAERVMLARNVLAKIVASQDGRPAAFNVEETEFIAYAVVNQTGLKAVA